MGKHSITRVRKLYDAAQIRSVPPVNLKKGDEVFFGTPPFTYEVSDSYLLHISNALITDNGIVLQNLNPVKRLINCYEADFKHYALKYIINVLLRYKWIKTNPAKAYLLIFDNYAGPNGFFHWIADNLTRLVELKDVLKSYTVIVPEYFKKGGIYRETLSLFDIGEVLYIPERSCVQIKNLFVADFIAPTGLYQPQNVKKLRNYIWEKCEVEKSNSVYSKIYISRKKAKRRFVENEDEVITLVQQYGFSVVCMEDYTFKQQVQLVYNANCLISIHGAALTHVCFMQENAHVLEFRKENDGHNNLYYSLASLLGVHYYYQFCKAEEISTAGNNFDLYVNTDELQENIHTMLTTMTLTKS